MTPPRNAARTRRRTIMNKPNNAVVVDKCTKRVNALKAHASPKAEIPVAGKTLKVTDVIGIYQNSLDTRAALSAKRAEVKALQVEVANAEAKRREADRALKPWVANTYGADSQQAHEFGFPPAKVPHRTADDKALAVQKNLATRKARHTMGKKQKLDITGVVDAT